MCVRRDETPQAPPPIEVEGLSTVLRGQVIHQKLNLEMCPGEVLGLIGASGAGKSVLLRSIVGLLPPAEGTIRIFGEDLYCAGTEALAEIKARWGVLFQGNALFSTLTVLENIAVPLREHGLHSPWAEEVAAVKGRMAGLPDESLHRFPAELSGGMRKRAGVARAIAHDPELLLLDEPTAGLDAIMADQIDRLVRSLADRLGLTVLLITHDLDSLYAITDRVAVIADRRIVAAAPVAELEASRHPWVRRFFGGRRSRAALAATP
jgi:phospholipid/cholesterol/gamma-HCH transport system ATP-binding protein